MFDGKRQITSILHLTRIAAAEYNHIRCADASSFYVIYPGLVGHGTRPRSLPW